MCETCTPAVPVIAPDDTRSPQTRWAIIILRWDDQLAVLCAEAHKTSGQSSNMHVFLLILIRAPGTFVKGPELIWPSFPVMTHSLDQKVLARKAKARNCTAEIDGNIQAKVDR